MMQFYIGQIILFAGNFAIRDLAYCNGQLLAIAQNSALFSILGTTYGGDGRTTFALPDLRGRVVVHSGGGSGGPGLTPRQLGSRAGQETVTLTTNQIPNHSHPTAVQVNNTDGEEANSAGQFISNHAGAFNEEGVSGQNLGGVTSGAVGGSQAHDNMQPWLALNYEIALFGIFPSRN
ncbi:MAG: phage tail protein [Flavobacteriaceae bacterium]|nr:phage tail protein [Flavobacteriaceae bacterium]